MGFFDFLSILLVWSLITLFVLTVYAYFTRKDHK